MGDIDNHQRGVLHMAVEGDFPTILSVLLEHAADPDLIDEGENTGRLHHYDIINQALILCLSAALLFVLFVVVYCLSPPPALHIAMQLGHMACVRVLLEESHINLLAINMKYGMLLLLLLTLFERLPPHPLNHPETMWSTT